MAKICKAWHKFLVCAPIKGLKLPSLLACKTGFYRPQHKAKGEPVVELSCESLEMQKRDVSIDII